MQIFLVITYYPNGSRRKRAFAFARAAQAYAAAHGEDVETEILEVPMRGEQQQPDVAFTLLWNDSARNPDSIGAVYGRYPDALQAAGCHGSVQEIQIDASKDAAFALQTIPCGARRRIEGRHPMAWLRRNREYRLLAACRPIA